MRPLRLNERTLPAQCVQVRIIARNEAAATEDGSTIKVTDSNFKLADYRTSLRDDPVIYNSA